MNEEINAYLNRLVSTLKSKGTIFCIGHDQIDVDAFFGGILAARLLKHLGLDSIFCILQPVKQDETYTILKNLTGIDLTNYECVIEEESRTLLLIDHYETTHAGTVIGCIDHHPTSKENTYPFSYVRNASASTYMVYELMKAANYPLSAEEAKYIVISMLVDTVAFRSSKTIPEEVSVAKDLSAQFNLDYDYFEKCALCLTPIDKMNIAEIVSNGQKKYTYNGHKVVSSYLQLYEMPAEETINEWLNYLKEKICENCETTPDMFVFVVFDTLNNKTYEYQICKDFCKSITHNGILSRGKDIMPRIEKEFSK